LSLYTLRVTEQLIKVILSGYLLMDIA